MKKKEFFDFLDKSLEGLPLEKKEKEIDRVVSKENIAEYKEKMLKGYNKCPLCGKYYDETLKLETMVKDELKSECICQDAGYGDDDVYGLVRYTVIYKKCPRCKRFFVKNKYCMEIIK